MMEGKEEIVIDLDEGLVERNLQAYRDYVTVGNKLLHALKVQYKEKLCAFRWDLLKKFFQGVSMSDHGLFFDYLHSEAAKANVVWQQHSEALGIEITKESFPVAPFGTKVTALIDQFAALASSQFKVSQSYIVELENGEAVLDEVALTEELRNRYGLILKDKEEIEMYREGEACSALLQRLMQRVLASTPVDQRPMSPYGHNLAVIDLERLFDINLLEGTIKPSKNLIPRLNTEHMNLFSASQQQSKAEAYKQNAELNPNDNNDWAKLQTQVLGGGVETGESVVKF